jgi:hypothetical protein
MHYSGHMRERFVRSVDEGFPAVAVVERNYEELVVPADVMLGQMLHCSDVLPRSVVEDVGDKLGLKRSEWRATYGEAARRLLAATSVR